MLPRYIDIFLKSDLPAAALTQWLSQQLGISLKPALSQVAEVIAVYSDPTTPHHWFDLWTGLTRHPDYPYQLYVGNSKQDTHSHYRINLAWWLLERLAGQIPMIFEISDGSSQIISERISSSSSRDLLTRILHLSDAPCQQIFLEADVSPSTIARAIKHHDWRMKKINRKGSPVIAEYLTADGTLTLETNYVWSLPHFDVGSYRYLLNGAQLTRPAFEEITTQFTAYRARLAQDFAFVN